MNFEVRTLQETRCISKNESVSYWTGLSSFLCKTATSWLTRSIFSFCDISLNSSKDASCLAVWPRVEAEIHPTTGWCHVLLTSRATFRTWKLLPPFIFSELQSFQDSAFVLLVSLLRSSCWIAVSKHRRGTNSICLRLPKLALSATCNKDGRLLI